MLGKLVRTKVTNIIGIVCGVDEKNNIMLASRLDANKISLHETNWESIVTIDLPNEKERYLSLFSQLPQYIYKDGLDYKFDYKKVSEDKFVFGFSRLKSPKSKNKNWIYTLPTPCFLEEGPNKLTLLLKEKYLIV